MTFTRKQQKITLVALIAVIVLLNIYFALSQEKPKTAPLTYAPGAVATSPVRVSSRAGSADPLNVFLERREEKFPGVLRDIFRMENPAPKVKPLPKQAIVVAPTTTATTTIPVKTPEQIAEDAARADLRRFRFLGYLTDKDNTLFLSKDGELIMVKSGDKLMKSYQVKESTKDYVILYDTVTRVEVRVDLSGSEQAPQPVMPQVPMWRR
jgi:hypothetical protein